MTKPVVIDLSEASESIGLVFASNFVLIVFALVVLSIEASDVFFASPSADDDGHWWERYVAGPGLVALMGSYLWLALTMDYSARYLRRHALAGAIFAALLIGGVVVTVASMIEWSWTFLFVSVIFLALFAPLIRGALGLLGASISVLESRVGPDQVRLVEILDNAEDLREPPAAQRHRAAPFVPILGRFFTGLGILGITGLALSFIIVGVFEARDPVLSDKAAEVGGLLILALPISGLLLILGGRMSQPSAHRLLATDKRAPVVLLRSFGDDPAKVKSRNVLRRFMFYGFGRGIRLEAAISRELSALGPLVAIGQPGEQLPQLGAARDYYADDEWQEAVLGWTTRARFVALIAGRTEGVVWELRQLLAGGTLDKTLLLFPPDSPEGKADRWRVISGCLVEAGMAVALEADLLEDLLAVYFPGDGTAPTVIRSKTYGQVDYELVVRVAAQALLKPLQRTEREQV